MIHFPGPEHTAVGLKYYANNWYNCSFLCNDTYDNKILGKIIYIYIIFNIFYMLKTYIILNTYTYTYVICVCGVKTKAISEDKQKL